MLQSATSKEQTYTKIVPVDVCKTSSIRGPAFAANVVALNAGHVHGFNLGGSDYIVWVRTSTVDIAPRNINCLNLILTN